MNIDHKPFIRTICERPADDGPRLVYADWLEDRGECDRAEFIRVQCEKRDLSYHFQRLIDKHNWRSLFSVGRAFDVILVDYKERTGQYPGYIWGGSPSPTGPGLYKCGAEEVWIEYRPLVKLVIRRGFVARVHLTTELFLGRRCQHVFTRSAWISSFDMKDCKLCHGVGYISGLAKPLFQNNPIEEVLLIDRAPYLYEWGFAAHWYDLVLTGGSPVHPESDVPSVIYQLLEGVKLSRHKEYKSEQDARADLSRACVKYGRSLISWSNEEGISDEEASEPQVEAGSNAH